MVGREAALLGVDVQGWPRGRAPRAPCPGRSAPGDPAARTHAPRAATASPDRRPRTKRLAHPPFEIPLDVVLRREKSDYSDRLLGYPPRPSLFRLMDNNHDRFLECPVLTGIMFYSRDLKAEDLRTLKRDFRERPLLSSGIDPGPAGFVWSDFENIECRKLENLNRLHSIGMATMARIREPAGHAIGCPSVNAVLYGCPTRGTSRWQFDRNTHGTLRLKRRRREQARNDHIQERPEHSKMNARPRTLQEENCKSHAM